MVDEDKRLPVRFFRSSKGREPVREWLLTLKDDQERKIIGADIKTVEYGWPMGMPTCSREPDRRRWRNEQP